MSEINFNEFKDFIFSNSIIRCSGSISRPNKLLIQASIEKLLNNRADLSKMTFKRAFLISIELLNNFTRVDQLSDSCFAFYESTDSFHILSWKSKLLQIHDMNKISKSYDNIKYFANHQSKIKKTLRILKIMRKEALRESTFHFEYLVYCNLEILSNVNVRLKTEIEDDNLGCLNYIVSVPKYHS